MQIKTNFNIGDRVWVVNDPIINNEYYHHEPSGEVTVYDANIIKIAISSDKEIAYICDDGNSTYLREEDVILYEELDKLSSKIKVIMDKIHEREE